MVGRYSCMCMIERMIVVCEFEMQAAAKLFNLHFSFSTFCQYCANRLGITHVPSMA